MGTDSIPGSASIPELKRPGLIEGTPVAGVIVDGVQAIPELKRPGLIEGISPLSSITWITRAYSRAETPGPN